MSAWAQSNPPPPAVSTGASTPALLTTVPSEVAGRNLIKRIDPDYPALVKGGYAQVPVKFAITITESGTVTDVALIRGDMGLIDAAKKAVLQWRYTPFTVNGKPVRVRLIVDLPFSRTDEKENDCRGAYDVQQYSKAEPVCKEAAMLVGQLPKNRNGERVQVHGLFGHVLEAEQKYKEALAEFQKELASAEKMPNPGVMLGYAYRDTATAYQLTGDTAHALLHYERAEQVLREAPKYGEVKKRKGASQSGLKQILEKHAALLEETGHMDDAAALRREADQIH